MTSIRDGTATANFVDVLAGMLGGEGGRVYSGPFLEVGCAHLRPGLALDPLWGAKVNLHGLVGLLPSYSLHGRRF